jgi:hypothetical protein
LGVSEEEAASVFREGTTLAGSAGDVRALAPELRPIRTEKLRAHLRLSSGVGTKSGNVRIMVETNPSTNPKVPMTNVLLRNSAVAADAPMRKKRSHGWSMATNSRTSASMIATVIATSAMTPVRRVSPDSSRAILNTTQTARWASGTRSVMQSTSTTTHATTMRHVATPRPGERRQLATEKVD